MTPHIDPLMTTPTLAPQARPLGDLMFQWRAEGRRPRSRGMLFWSLWAAAFLPDLAALALVGWLVLAPSRRRLPAPDDPLPAAITWIAHPHNEPDA